MRLIESLEGICDTLLSYNVHKERTDSTRFSKGMSTTFKTLHGLVDKGVKVDLGIPYDLWDKPSAEVTYLKSQVCFEIDPHQHDLVNKFSILQCENMIEQHESDIEEWYFKHQQDKSLSEYLCADRVLKHDDDQCLNEKIIENEIIAKKTEL